MQDKLRLFARARDWEQFHSPKNLAMALTGEVGELVAHFQWLTESASATVMADRAIAQNIRYEMADVLAYLLRLADVLGVDLVAALTEKMDANERRYPVDRAKGNARKYTELQRD